MRADKFPLQFSELTPGCLYEADNGTHVMVPEPVCNKAKLPKCFRALSLEQASGAYADGPGRTMFRLLKNSIVSIATGPDGYVKNVRLSK